MAQRPEAKRAPRQPGLDELRLLTKVARLYHERGIRQPQIATELNLSQARISRMLKQAEELGIVTTVITMPRGVHGELEDAVQQRYGLRDVVVVDATGDSEIVPALGSAAASYLNSTLTRGRVVGISSWSETLLAVVARMPRRNAATVDRVVQLMGGVGDPDAQVKENRLIAQFADACGAMPVFLPAPGLVGSPEVRRAILGDPSIGEVVAIWADLTDAVVGIGAVEQSPILERSSNAVNREEREDLRRLGAVGDICFRFFDENGTWVEPRLEQRIVGITPGQLLKTPRRIGVAGGERKFTAVRAAVRGGWINVLITDLNLAQRLVQQS